MSKNKAVNEYKAESIQVLTGLEPVRKRPGMYIGSTGPSGLHHLVWEVIDNAIDEAMAGYATLVDIEILKDGKLRVSDNGRGIPVEKHPQTKKSTLETVMTMLHAGGRIIIKAPSATAPPAANYIGGIGGACGGCNPGNPGSPGAYHFIPGP